MLLFLTIMENILIAETDRIGDLILTLPVFKSIKMFNKDIRITALVRSYTADIFKNFQYIDKVLSYTDLDTEENISTLLLKIKSLKFDTAIVLHPEYKIAKILKKAGIKKRFSYGWKLYQFLFSKVMIQHRSKNIKNQLEYNLELLKLININKFDTDIKLNPQPEDLKHIDAILRSKKLNNKPLIGIHPGSGHSSLNLPPDKYAELIDHISKYFKKPKIILTGSPKDKHIIDHILTKTKAKLYPMPSNLSLSELIALISRTRIFISNSTGPMHIASALRIPLVAFFSPVFIHSPVRWGPYWGKRLVKKPDIECPKKWKCNKDKCAYYNCFDKIEFDKVLTFIKNSI